MTDFPSCSSERSNASNIQHLIVYTWNNGNGSYNWYLSIYLCISMTGNGEINLDVLAWRARMLFLQNNSSVYYSISLQCFFIANFTLPKYKWHTNLLQSKSSMLIFIFHYAQRQTQLKKKKTLVTDINCNNKFIPLKDITNNFYITAWMLICSATVHWNMKYWNNEKEL